MGDTVFRRTSLTKYSKDGVLKDVQLRGWAAMQVRKAPRPELCGSSRKREASVSHAHLGTISSSFSLVLEIKPSSSLHASLHKRSISELQPSPGVVL